MAVKNFVRLFIPVRIAMLFIYIYIAFEQRST